MKLETIFKEFISVVQENQKYSIALLNCEGKVLSSSEAIYIGEQFTPLENQPDQLFLTILIRQENYGYLWVKGSEDNLKMIGELLLDTLTTRILYEINENILQQKLTKDDELIKYLLDPQKFQHEAVLKLTHELKVDEEMVRVAMLIHSEHRFELDEILRLKLKADSSEIFYSLIEANTLLIFKDVHETTRDRMKTEISKYVRELQEWGLIECRFYIGSMQHKLSQYHESYKTCQWLEKNYSLGLNEAMMIQDVEYEYLLSSVEVSDVLSTFDWTIFKMKHIDIEEFITITCELVDNDFNISQAASKLFLHKNTLIYKIQKYEDSLGIDIRNSFKGKVLLYLISCAFQDRLKRKQVGDRT